MDEVVLCLEIFDDNGLGGLETPARRRPQISRQGRRADASLLPPETGSEFHVILVFVANEVSAFVGRPFPVGLNNRRLQAVEMEQGLSDPLQRFTRLVRLYVLLSKSELGDSLRYGRGGHDR